MQRYYLMTLICSLLTVLASAKASSPPPEGPLSVEWMLNQAIDSSPSLERLKNSNTALRAQQVRWHAAHEPRLSSQLSIERQNPQLGSQGPESQNQVVNLGASKAFATGTSIESNLSLKRREPTTSSSSPHHDTQISASIRQSLWRDSFGRSQDLDRQALKAEAQSSYANSRHSATDLLLRFIGEYYLLWSQTADLKAEKERLAREQRRLAIFERQYAAGFIEEPTLVQSQASVLRAQHNRDTTLFNIKTSLIRLREEIAFPLESVLKDPEHYLRFAPENLTNQLQLCQGAPPASHQDPLWQSHTQAAKASEWRLQRLRDQQKPDLFVGAQFSSQSRDQQLGSSFTEGLTGKQPGWSLFIGIEQVLGDASHRADRLVLARQKVDQQLAASISASEGRSDFRRQCAALKHQEAARQTWQQKSRLDERRVQLLDRDFGLGKADLTTLLQAEDDLSSSRSTYTRSAVAAYSAAWRLRQLSGHLNSYLDRLLPKPTDHFAEGSSHE